MIAVSALAAVTACALAPGERVVADSGRAVVTERQAERGAELRATHRACLRTANRWTVVRETSDVAGSGAKADRALFAGRFAAVVWKSTFREGTDDYSVSVVDLRRRRLVVAEAAMTECACIAPPLRRVVLGTRGHVAWLVPGTAERLMAQAGRRRIAVTGSVARGSISDVRLSGPVLTWTQDGERRRRRLPAL